MTRRSGSLQLSVAALVSMVALVAVACTAPGAAPGSSSTAATAAPSMMEHSPSPSASAMMEHSPEPVRDLAAMAPLIAFAFLAGVLTILSPCTLPVVPMVVGVGSPDRRHRLLGVVAGFGLTFVAVSVLLAAALAGAGITTSGLRVGAALLIGAAGATLAVPALAGYLDRATSGLAELGRRGLRTGPRSGLASGLVLGSAIGLIWAPCAGPIMAAVLAAAVTTGPSTDAALVAGVYVVGASLPLALIALGGRRMIGRFGGSAGRARLRQSSGIVMLAAAALVVTGLDVPIQSAVGNVLPAGLSASLASIEQQPTVIGGLDMLRGSPGGGPVSTPAVPGDRGLDPGVASGMLPEPIASSLPASVALDDEGPAPVLSGITAWLNSPPLTLAALRGKVVLVHFWTFACSNCLNVQPYVKAWYQRYAAAGLVVIGVHTPELSFERDLANVRDAVAAAAAVPGRVRSRLRDLECLSQRILAGLLLRRQTGRIRHEHFGEGDYAGSEQVIRQLLAEPAQGG